MKSMISQEWSGWIHFPGPVSNDDSGCIFWYYADVR